MISLINLYNWNPSDHDTMWMDGCELHGSREKGNKSWMWTHTSEIMEIATLSRQVESNCSYGGYEYGIDPKGWGYGSFPRLRKETNGSNKMIARGPHQNSLRKATLLLHLMLGSSSYLAFHGQLSHTISHGRGPFCCMASSQGEFYFAIFSFQNFLLGNFP